MNDSCEGAKSQSRSPASAKKPGFCLRFKLFNPDFASLRLCVRFLFVALVIVCCAIAGAQPEPPQAQAPLRYSVRANHDPNGIGKFYMGREIAHVMGFVAADWLERPEREAEESL